MAFIQRKINVTSVENIMTKTPKRIISMSVQEKEFTTIYFPLIFIMLERSNGIVYRNIF